MAKYTTDDVFWAHELRQCADDFDYLATKYLRFKSKWVIGFPTLKFNPVQAHLLSRIRDQWQRTGKVRQVWGKARQTGASTLSRALSFQRTAFRNHTNALLVAHSEPDAMELFQLDTGFYDALPPRLRPELKYRSKSKMEFTNRNSKLLVNHAQNLHVGASQMNHIVHLTEVARYPNAYEIQSSLFPSISAAKGKDCSVVLIESTSHIDGTWFKDFAEEARAGKNDYEFTFVPWYLLPEYSLPVPKGFELTAIEKDLLRQHPHLTYQNLVWYRLERSNYAGNLAQFIQNYPFSWEESWILPVGTFRTFTDEMMAYMQPRLCPGMRHIVDSTGLRENIGGEIEVWETPQAGVYYDLGVDVSGGKTESADWTVLEVIRRDTLAQVAECRLHIDPASVEFFDLVYWLGRTYNTAQMIPDITGGWGHALLSDLQRRGYSNIWQWRRRDDLMEKVSTRLGFYYTKRDKSWLVHNAVKVVQREQPLVRSKLLYDEMVTFVTTNIDEWGASTGCYDDAINAYMLALLGAMDERPAQAPELPKSTQAALPKPWAVHDVEQDLLDGSGKAVAGSWVERVLSVQ